MRSNFFANDDYLRVVLHLDALRWYYEMTAGYVDSLRTAAAFNDMRNDVLDGLYYDRSPREALECSNPI